MAYLGGGQVANFSYRALILYTAGRIVTSGYPALIAAADPGDEVVAPDYRLDQLGSGSRLHSQVGDLEEDAEDMLDLMAAEVLEESGGGNDTAKTGIRRRWHLD